MEKITTNKIEFKYKPHTMIVYRDNFNTYAVEFVPIPIVENEYPYAVRSGDLKKIVDMTFEGISKRDSLAKRKKFFRQKRLIYPENRELTDIIVDKNLGEPEKSYIRDKTKEYSSKTDTKEINIVDKDLDQYIEALDDKSKSPFVSIQLFYQKNSKY